jgi:hypothetical protein
MTAAIRVSLQPGIPILFKEAASYQDSRAQYD